MFSRLLALFGAFALLVGDAAAGLAGRLAGSLAFAAAAVLGALAQVTGFDGLDVFHNGLPPPIIVTEIMAHSAAKVNVFVLFARPLNNIIRYLRFCCALSQIIVK